MLDQTARRLIDPPLDRMGRALAGRGVTADGVTLAGLALGLMAAGAIWADALGVGLALILASRLMDGLDGAVARASRPSDFGGYLDIVCDYVFYAAIPLAFALRDPGAAAAAALLVASFYVNAGSFLGYAILAEKHGHRTDAQGAKSLYYSNGILEGTETIAFFVLLCLLPGAFVPLALTFAALCLLTAGLRVVAARAAFPPRS
ncbi:MAG: CDP-alcohol phosphatidyltransferase family protein [Paracoccaceae bacterium]